MFCLDLPATFVAVIIFVLECRVVATTNSALAEDDLVTGPIVAGFVDTVSLDTAFGL